MKKIILSILSIIVAFASIGQNIQGYYVTGWNKLEAKRAFVIDLDTFYATTQLNGMDTILATKDYVDSRIIDTVATNINSSNWITYISNHSGPGGSFVPYTGATDDVDLGSYNLLANKLGIGVAAGANERIKARLNNATNYTALFENSGGGYGLKIAAGSASNDILLSMHDYSTGYEYFRFTGNGYFRTPNQTVDPSNVADYGFWYFKNNKPYAYINSVAYDLSHPLTTKGDLFTYSTTGARLPVGTNGYMLSANSATSTGLEWVAAPAGSKWTDGGTYIYPTTYEDIYLTSNKSISWRNATSNPGAANNLWQIIPGTGKLVFNEGSTPTTVMELLTGGSLALDGTVSIGANAYSFPSSDGSSGQVQQTNGLGVLSWYTPISLTSFSSTATGLTYTNTTGVFSLTSGYSIPTTTNQTNWTTAYNDKVNSLAFSGTTTKTLTLTQQDGGTVSNTFTDLDAQTLALDSTATTYGITISGQNRIHFNKSSGGSMVYPSAGIAVSNGSAWLTSPTGTASQLFRRNAGNTAYEFFTPNYMNGSGTVTSGVFPIYNGTGGNDLAQSYLSANLTHGGITNTISTTAVYSATFINTNNTGGFGLFVRGGVGSVSNIAQFNDYNNTARFSIRGDGALFAPTLPTAINDNDIMINSSTGAITQGIAPENNSLLVGAGLSSAYSFDALTYSNIRFATVSASTSITINNADGRNTRFNSGTIVILHANTTAYTITLYFNTDGSGNDATVKTPAGSGQVVLTTSGNGYSDILEWKYLNGDVFLTQSVVH